MWIKICGICDVDTALRVAALGPDAIGLNFYDRSPRCVAPDVAAAIVRRLPAHVEPVGVFVNHTLSEVHALSAACGLHTVQLHGDEPPEFAAALCGFSVIRARRVGAQGLQDVGADIERCRRLGVALRACLIDARVEGAYGGTGHTPPWDRLHAEWREDWPPLVLAGGLTPDNVCAAVSLVHPWGLDVATGVESSPAVKDLVRVGQFIRAARAV
jgi:phosphoribosylanthranilate isomerase